MSAKTIESVTTETTAHPDRNLRPLGFTVLALVISLVSVVPLIWVVSTSLKTGAEVTAAPLALPTALNWDNYPRAWEQGRFGTYFVNSVVVSAVVVIGVLVLSLMAAYAFALMKFRGRTLLFVYFLVGLTIPLSVLVIPIFYQMLELKLLSTLWALILPQIATGLPFGILLLRSFIRDIPSEILDAARVDGCSRIRMLLHIVTPLTRPALLSLLIFNFMWSWNQFMLPSFLIQQDSMRTLPAGLRFFIGRYSNDIPLLMAGATISFLPILIVYVIFQRQFIQGISAGALSGQ
ncbi:MAG: carbohydrate ABC transporter permease [Chloroflexi bacterium]|nr:carbohydrate ABC transporter permease [Chloroflexota bacterium]